MEQLERIQKLQNVACILCLHSQIKAGQVSYTTSGLYFDSCISFKCFGGKIILCRQLALIVHESFSCVDLIKGYSQDYDYLSIFKNNVICSEINKTVLLDIFTGYGTKIVNFGETRIPQMLYKTSTSLALVLAQRIYMDLALIRSLHQSLLLYT